ncbi:MAG TPA: VOC family protein [Acidimicrobiia bacterium]|nr:VOC family protein [Acidimicrobiia bacterium]
MSYDGFVTFVRTRDLDRSEEFYVGSLGLERVLDQGTCRIFRVSGSGYLGVCRGEPDPNGVVITLVATDVRERCAELERAGVHFEKRVTYNADYDITHAFVRDPDGHLVEIQRFESADWPG